MTPQTLTHYIHVKSLYQSRVLITCTPRHDTLDIHSLDPHCHYISLGCCLHVPRAMVAWTLTHYIHIKSLYQSCVLITCSPRHGSLDIHSLSLYQSCVGTRNGRGCSLLVWRSQREDGWLYLAKWPALEDARAGYPAPRHCLSPGELAAGPGAQAGRRGAWEDWRRLEGTLRAGDT